jgi:hypothetical protein
MILDFAVVHEWKMHKTYDQKLSRGPGYTSEYRILQELGLELELTLPWSMRVIGRKYKQWI